MIKYVIVPIKKISNRPATSLLMKPAYFSFFDIIISGYFLEKTIHTLKVIVTIWTVYSFYINHPTTFWTPPFAYFHAPYYDYITAISK